ncbi:MAG: aldo/keto reductase [Archangium sp.]
MPWLTREDSRIALGCMRLLDDATVHAALEAGVTVFDTAHAYTGNEALLGRALAAHPLGAKARVVTKGGLVRDGAAWRSDARAKALVAQCEASREALGRAIDLYLLHAVDPRVPLTTSMRALETLRRGGVVRAIGVSNVTRAQLEEAASVAALSAGQESVSVFDDGALKSGVVERALELGLSVQCYAPLGGPKRAKSVNVLDALGALLALDEQVMVLVGASRPESIREAARAVPKPSTKLSLRRVVPATREEPGITLLMGPQGAGKTSAALQSSLTRLNRDLEGGTLKSLHARLDAALARGERGFVLDNTYVTRAQRYDVLRLAEKYGQAVHGRWFDIDAAEAQVNIISRMLEVHGRLLEPGELLRSTTPDALGPGAHFRTCKTIERPEVSEGFTTLTTVPFVRRPWPDGRAARFVGIDQLDAIPQTSELIIVVGWKEGGLSTPHPTFVCPHAGGPPVCWCRPPLPGLFLAAARQYGISFAKSRLVSNVPALKTVAKTLRLTSS